MGAPWTHAACPPHVRSIPPENNNKGAEHLTKYGLVGFKLRRTEFTKNSYCVVFIPAS